MAGLSVKILQINMLHGAAWMLLLQICYCCQQMWENKTSAVYFYDWPIYLKPYLSHMEL